MQHNNALYGLFLKRERQEDVNCAAFFRQITNLPKNYISSRHFLFIRMETFTTCRFTAYHIMQIMW